MRNAWQVNRFEKATNAYAKHVVLFASEELAARAFESTPDAIALVRIEDGDWGVEVVGAMRAMELMQTAGGIDFCEAIE